MNRKILMVSILTLLLDQISKALIAMFFHLNEKVVVLKNFFSIHYIHNYGAAWNLFNNKIPFIIGISFLSLLVIYHFMYVFETNRRNNLAFGLVVGGMTGNLMDRWLFGYVRDFFDFQLFNYSYPVFNVADIAIVFGILLLILAIIKGEDRREKLDCRTK